MAKELKTDYTDVRALVEMRLRYAFEQPLTEKQIRTAVLAGEYYDITDEEIIDIKKVISVDMTDAE